MYFKFGKWDNGKKIKDNLRFIELGILEQKKLPNSQPKKSFWDKLLGYIWRRKPYF
jgi:hypothetical protein